MTDISIRISGRAGRITLTRPQALNAMTYDMCLAIEDAFDAWQHDPKVDLIILDAEGDRAFCSGGDIAELYATGTKGNYAYGRKFWADEYRLNAKIFAYTKPVVSFLQGFILFLHNVLQSEALRRWIQETNSLRTLAFLK